VYTCRFHRPSQTKSQNLIKFRLEKSTCFRTNLIPHVNLCLNNLRSPIKHQYIRFRCLESVGMLKVHKKTRKNKVPGFCRTNMVVSLVHTVVSPLMETLTRSCHLISAPKMYFCVFARKNLFSNPILIPFSLMHP